MAPLIVDRVIDGTGPEGQDVHVEGTADIAQRGPDGGWRYVVDNPFGTRVQQFHTQDTGEPAF
ncbi:hypothetical protein ACIQSP_03790 [Streptomyces nigra]|uniref:hypothetical protein n=1 Tax=Streptomyces nigra TaxID=1827580 RepID=UPI00380F8113